MAIPRLRLKKLLRFLFPILVLLIVWELLVDFRFLNPRLFPSPSNIGITMYELTIPNFLLITYLFRSLYRLAIGYAIGVAFGIPLGILMGTSKHLYKLVSPVLSMLISIPTIAWVPLFLIIIGIGDETIILTIFLGCFFCIVYNTMYGVRSVNKELIWAAKMTGANKTTIFAKVILPGALVSIITGLRLAVGYSWRALVGAEMLASITGGIGFMIYAARATFATKIMFTGLFIIALGGLLIDRFILGTIEKRTIEKWGMVRRRE